MRGRSRNIVLTAKGERILAKQSAYRKRIVRKRMRGVDIDAIHRKR